LLAGKGKKEIPSLVRDGTMIWALCLHNYFISWRHDSPRTFSLAQWPSVELS
jgi:hypothetical protein